MKWGFATKSGDIVICDGYDEAVATKESLGIECSPIHSNSNGDTLYEYLKTATMDIEDKKRIRDEIPPNVAVAVA